MLIPVILCGGSGSRLWPMSRSAYPKQFLTLLNDEQSLLQETVSRLDGVEDIAHLTAICNQEHRFLVAEQLQPFANYESSIILEPVGRNTAPALAIAAFEAIEKDPESILLVLPSDHSIMNMSAFQVAVRDAVALAKQDKLVTFGVVPTSPETGYGYIEKGESIPSSCAFLVKQFAEKPEQSVAEAYIESNNFYWNSGMFVFKASVYLEELKRHAQDIESACKEAFAAAKTDLDFIRIDEGAFKNCRSESIDYAVMEHTDVAAVVPLDADWSDVGSWTGLAELTSADDCGNVSVGDTLLHDTNNCYVRSTSRLVSTVGLNNAVVVETSDAVLVADKSSIQDVKSVVASLQTTNRSEVDLHKVVYRPWGSYESIVEADRFQVKRIIVNPGQKLSMQKHFHRAEHWIIVKGTATVTCGENIFTLNEDQSTYIPIGDKHRLENPGKIPLELIEVQSGSYLGEDDIVRFDDVYGR